MPQGARYEDLENFAMFRKYTTANVTAWYNGPRRREAKNGDVHLVSFNKTTSWGITIFVNQTQQNSCRLKLGPSKGDSATSTFTWSENSGVTDIRAGSDSDKSDELRIYSDPPDFQFEKPLSFFVRTLKYNSHG